MQERGKIDWRDHIHSDPLILVGKPVIRGTRLSVDFLLELLANGWTDAEILANYPALKPDDLRAVFAYASDHLRQDTVHVLSPA